MVDGAPVLDVQFSLEHAYLKEGCHTLVIPIENKLLELIGNIAVQWGHYEVIMNALIEAFHVRLCREPPQRWQRLGFKKRKELFRDIMGDYFTAVGWQDEIAPFKAICARAADLHWRRNVIVHGFYRAAREAGPVRYTAWGNHKGREVSIPITDPILRQLFHDLAHLNGEVAARLAARGASIDDLSLAFDDTQILQGPEHGSFEFLPNANMQPPPPQSSEL